MKKLYHFVIYVDVRAKDLTAAKKKFHYVEMHGSTYIRKDLRNDIKIKTKSIVDEPKTSHRKFRMIETETETE